jgi:hypothetical protein
MGIFSSKPTQKEVKAFAAGKKTSAKAAEAYVQRQARQKQIRAAQTARKKGK